MTAAPHDIDALLDSSALQIAAAVRSRQVSAEEITTASLARARERGPAVGAFVRLTPDLALAQARAVDETIARARREGLRIEGSHVPASEIDAALERLLPLAGVPCPIKDLQEVAGVPIGAGSRVLEQHPVISEADDGTVRLLRQAGTTMIGKSATPEFGFPPYTEPRLGPGGAIVAARTPWDLTRGAGGSSGGAGAAVAAGVTPLAHGSDGGGSIRIPASACGLVGLKPSRGRVSNGPLGVDAHGLATQGVLTRTVRDSAAGLDVLNHSWPGEVMAFWGAGEASMLELVEAVERAGGPDLGRTPRIGLLTQPLSAADAVVHPEAEAAALRAARVLEGLGMVVEPAPVPYTPAEWMAFMPLWAVGAVTLPIGPEAVGLLEPLTQWLREVGDAVTGAQYQVAVADAQRLARKVAAAWGGFDAVLTPTLAGPPEVVGTTRDDADPAAEFENQKRFTPWTSTANIVGAPSISVPIHRAVVDGVELPFGAMLTGRIGQDGLLLQLARLLEIADPWPAPPQLPVAG